MHLYLPMGSKPAYVITGFVCAVFGNMASDNCPEVRSSTACSGRVGRATAAVEKDCLLGQPKRGFYGRFNLTKLFGWPIYFS